jgi:hypothetical protein
MQAAKLGWSARSRASSASAKSDLFTPRQKGNANPRKVAVQMATRKQTQAARKNVKKAAKAATSKKSIAKMPKKVKTALGKQGAAVAQRKKTGSSSPKTRQELYEEAKRRNIRGRSKMGRDELAKALGGRS